MTAVVASLKKARVSMHISQAALARLIGVSDNTIQNAEGGHKAISRELAERLAAVLAVDAVGLYARSALDQMRSAMDTTPESYRPTTVAIGLAKLKAALEIWRELDTLDLPDEMLVEKADLINRIADELHRLEEATRDIEHTKRSRSNESNLSSERRSGRDQFPLERYASR
jgi:transcriptional regulator with XRE-family HTH domain